MSDTYKPLAQAYPAAGVLTDLYTGIAGSGTVIGTVVMCNQGLSQALVRVSVAIAGAADTPAQYLYYNLPIDSYDTIRETIGLTVANTDVVRVYSSTGTVSFNLTGVQVT